LFANIRTVMSVKSDITDKQIRTASYFKTIGNPVRMYVLELLSIHYCCYRGDLSEELPIAKLILSQQLCKQFSWI